MWTVVWAWQQEKTEENSEKTFWFVYSAHEINKSRSHRWFILSIYYIKKDDQLLQWVNKYSKKSPGPIVQHQWVR